MRPRASWVLILAPIFSNNFTVSSWRPEMACIKGVEPWKEKNDINMKHFHSTKSIVQSPCPMSTFEVPFQQAFAGDLASEVVSIPLYVWTISQLQCNNSCAHIKVKEAKLREGLKIQCLLTFISIDTTITSF